MNPRNPLIRAAKQLAFAADLYDAMVRSKGDVDGELDLAAAEARNSAAELLLIAWTPPPTPLELAMRNYNPTPYTEKG